MPELRQVSVALPDGTGAMVDLHVVVQGDGPALMLLHGFTGCVDDLAWLAGQLQDEFTVYRVDLVGHGRSAVPSEPGSYTMASCLAQLCALLDSLSLERAHWLGYSMGARVVLSLCATYPERVCSAVLIGASPGIADPILRAERVTADAVLAQRLEQRGIVDFIDYWLALPLFASQRRLGEPYRRQQRTRRLANSATGLAASLRGMGCGAMAPLHDVLPGIACPIGLIVGAEDEKFVALARDMVLNLANAQLAVIADAGHAAHLEQPQACAAAIRQFLLRQRMASQQL